MCRVTRRPLVYANVAVALVALCMLVAAGGSSADPPSKLVSAPITGAAIVTHGKFTNLFLWPNPGTESWNSHLGKVAGADMEATTQRIDAIATGLVESSFFDLLTQYGIEPPIFTGEEITTQACVNPAMSNASSNGGVIQWIALVEFVNCEKSASGIHSPQVNVFISPDLQVAGGLFSGLTTNICEHEIAGYHSGFLGTPNFTVIPTEGKCNANPSELAGTISHEMVETVSDPGGFGYLVETQPRFSSTDFEHGELGDVCTRVGISPAPETPFYDRFVSPGAVSLNPYWSNADAKCEPQHIMDSTLASLIGTSHLPDGTTGLIRMTNSVHNLSVPLTIPSALKTHYLQALELQVKTGGANLSGGNSRTSGANVLLKVRSNPTPILLEHINEGQEWGNNSFHALLLRLPPEITAEELTGLEISTNFTGGESWDINAVKVEAAIACGVSETICSETAEPPECPTLKERSLQPPPLVNITGTQTLADGSTGLARLTGSVHSWSTPVSEEAVYEPLVVTNLQLTIDTGGDNLRSGTLPGENATAIITLTNGNTIAFNNINQRQEWSNFSQSQAIELPISAFPQKMTLGDIKELTIKTNFGGGVSGDNWDILGAHLEAAVACETGRDPLPRAPFVALLNEIGTKQLADGSMGIVRMTGSTHSESFTLKPVSPSQANKHLAALDLTVSTGGDNLRGGFAPEENAEAKLKIKSGAEITFKDINQTEQWASPSKNTVDLLTLPSDTLPRGITLGELTGPMEIITSFGGGVSGDNWDIEAVKLVAAGD